LSFSSSGTRASSSWVNATPLHQQSPSKLLDAEAAHSFGLPHRGQMGAVIGRRATVIGLRPNEWKGLPRPDAAAWRPLAPKCHDGKCERSSTQSAGKVHDHRIRPHRSRQELVGRPRVNPAGKAERGAGQVRPDVPRAKLHSLIARLPACTIGREACSGPHHRAANGVLSSGSYLGPRSTRPKQARLQMRSLSFNGDPFDQHAQLRKKELPLSRMKISNLDSRGSPCRGVSDPIGPTRPQIVPRGSRDHRKTP
jgi:hypothetical protein